MYGQLHESVNAGVVPDLTDGREAVSAMQPCVHPCAQCMSEAVSAMQPCAHPRAQCRVMRVVQRSPVYIHVYSKPVHKLQHQVSEVAAIGTLLPTETISRRHAPGWLGFPGEIER